VEICYNRRRPPFALVFDFALRRLVIKAITLIIVAGFMQVNALLCAETCPSGTNFTECEKRLDKPRSVWYNGASDTIAIALRFRTGAPAPKISMKSRAYAIFFVSAMFHVEHGFWNACYKSARQMRMILIWDFSGTSSFSQQKKNPLSKKMRSGFSGMRVLE